MVELNPLTSINSIGSINPIDPTASIFLGDSDGSIEAIESPPGSEFTKL